jgi:F-type H+-transporting ATPase subunit b
MEPILRQLGELLLGSIPTIILLGLLYAIYTIVVHKPLVRVLSERHRLTQGAMEKARADIAAAEARTAEYERKIREARLGVFRAQEARRQKMMQARTAAVADARAKAHEQVRIAREAIEQDKAKAQMDLQSEAGRLAIEIIRSILHPVAAPAAGGRP